MYTIINHERHVNQPIYTQDADMAPSNMIAEFELLLIDYKRVYKQSIGSYEDSKLVDNLLSIESGLRIGLYIDNVTCGEDCKPGINS